MIYTEMTMRAMRLAYNAHHGQTDHSGLPYILHPLHLAEQMPDEISCAAALLHDVVEDTSVTLEMLKEQFPPAVTDAVALLTHEEGTDYCDYVRAIRSNPVAVQVKLADLDHNTDETRLTGVEFPAERIEYYRQKYARARAILTGND